MGGSSVPPRELWNKYNKPTKQQLIGERTSRLAIIRTLIHQCRTCINIWEIDPQANFLISEQFLRSIRGQIAKEPEPPIREEQENFLISPLVVFEQAIKRLSGHLEWRDQAQQAWHQLNEGFKRIWQAHRIRLSGGLDRISPREFKDLQSREDLLEYLNDLIAEHALDRLPDPAHHALREMASSFGFYLPPKRIDRRHYYSPEMFLLFGFLPPVSTKEELDLYESPLLRRRFRQFLRAHQTDVPQSEDQRTINTFWTRMAVSTWQRMQKRKWWLKHGVIPVWEGEELSRKPEAMIWKTLPENRGLQLPLADE